MSETLNFQNFAFPIYVHQNFQVPVVNTTSVSLANTELEKR
jgi:hypothetical protein